MEGINTEYKRISWMAEILKETSRAPAAGKDQHTRLIVDISTNASYLRHRARMSESQSTLN